MDCHAGKTLLSSHCLNLPVHARMGQEGNNPLLFINPNHTLVDT